MEYSGYKMPSLISGVLVKRYKRFLADVELETGETVTAHCPNSGSMKGCAIAGSRVWLSQSDNPKRKYKYTWELAKVPGTLIGINTLVPNRLVKQSIENGVIESLSDYDQVKAEVKTSSHTRLDLLLEAQNIPKCYVEIKNCTMVEDGVAMFPDAVTTRGQKHLDELIDLVSRGNRGIIFFLIQRMDAKIFKPAEHIDNIYAKKLRKAVEKKVEIIAMDTIINTDIISINKALPVHLE